MQDTRKKREASLSETVKGLQATAQTALALYAKDNPSVQRLVNGYELWETTLRTEAQKRLELGVAGGVQQDWDLLTKVGRSQGALTSSALAMKRSASENTLGRQQNQMVSRKQNQQMPNAKLGYSFQKEANLFGARHPMRRPNALGATPSEQHLLRLGLPSVPSAPDLQQLSEEAALTVETFFDNGRKALLNAQQSMQETANNCTQNLFQLGTLVQQNVAQTAKTQTWSLATSNDPFSGTMVPWSVFPRYLKAREAEAQGAEASSSDRAGDWSAPFDQLVQALDQQRRQGKAAAKNKSVRDPGRQVAIVTTAALPWLTGTSVNPLLRAAYLSNDGNRKVTLCIPWLSLPDQERLFPQNAPRFNNPEAQEDYIREWARTRTGLECNFRISFYPGRYADEKGERGGDGMWDAGPQGCCG